MDFMSDFETAIDLIKEMLPEDKAIRVVEFAMRRKLDDDDPVFFFMAMFETSARVLTKITERIAELQRSKHDWEKTQRAVDGEYQRARDNHVHDLTNIVARSEKLVSQQSENLTRIAIKAENLAKRLGELGLQASTVDNAWRSVTEAASGKAAYALTTKTFKDWFASHSLWFGEEAVRRIHDLVDQRLWLAYVVGGTLAAANILLVFMVGIVIARH
jgi:hypothetical protein